MNREANSTLRYLAGLEVLEPMSDKLNFMQEAEALRQAASDAYAALQLAHLRYEHALEISKGSLSTETVPVTRQQRHEYAEAVTRYTNAAMAWLAHSDIGAQESAKLARKANSHE
jgi:hypothetical protein